MLKKICVAKKFDDKESAESELKKMKKRYPYAYRALQVNSCFDCSGWHIERGGPIRHSI